MTMTVILFSWNVYWSLYQVSWTEIFAGRWSLSSTGDRMPRRERRLRPWCRSGWGWKGTWRPTPKPGTAWVVRRSDESWSRRPGLPTSRVADCRSEGARESGSNWCPPFRVCLQTSNGNRTNNLFKRFTTDVALKTVFRYTWYSWKMSAQIWFFFCFVTKWRFLKMFSISLSTELKTNLNWP